jgi:hypothetical protein
MKLLAFCPCPMYTLMLVSDVLPPLLLLLLLLFVLLMMLLPLLVVPLLSIIPTGVGVEEEAEATADSNPSFWWLAG